MSYARSGERPASDGLSPSDGATAPGWLLVIGTLIVVAILALVAAVFIYGGRVGAPGSDLHSRSVVQWAVRFRGFQ